MSDEPIAIVPDTNALFSKKALVGGEFLRDVAELRKLRQAEIVVPQIVFDERHFQLVSIATGYVETAAKAHDRLSKMFNIGIGTFSAPTDLKAEIESTLKQAFKSSNATIIPTPVGSIDWNRVIRDSVWRVPPFSQPHKEIETPGDDYEKGFRDAIFVQTVLSYVEQHRELQVLVVSSDELVQSALLVAKGTKMELYKKLSAFLSEIDLMRLDIAKEVAKNLPGLAADLFFNKELRTGFFTAERLSQTIYLQHTEVFKTVEASDWRPIAGSSWTTATGQEENLVSDPRFLRKRENALEWLSEVTFRRKYYPIAEASILREVEARWLNRIFHVIWSCELQDSKLGNPKLLEIKWIKTTSEASTYLVPGVGYGPFTFSGSASPLISYGTLVPQSGPYFTGVSGYSGISGSEGG